MNQQNQNNHDDLTEMQKLTEIQEAEFKQQEHGGQINNGQSNLQDVYMKRSRDNSIDSARSRSRSTNERKRNYNQQFADQKKDESPSKGDQSGQQQARSNRFTDTQESQGQQKQENDPNKSNSASSNNNMDYSKINFNQSLQQLQDMANKVDIPQIKLDNQAGYRHARRLYIGNIPETINQEYLSEWLYRSLEAAGGLQPSLPSENPIVKCEIDPKGRFAFTELRSIEETTALLQLDGIILWHRQLRIRRPTEYEKFPQVQGQFEVSIPKLNFDLFKTVGIVIIPTVVDDGPNKVFLANLPTKMDELMILDELKLRDMGEIKAFHLVKDNQTNQSKGYAFFEFKDPSLTDRCIEALHGMSYAGRTLTCKRSQVGGMGNKQPQNGGNRQQNNNRGMNQQNGNNMQKQQYYQGDQMEQNMNMQGMQQANINEGSNFFPNYQQNSQGQSATGNQNNNSNNNSGSKGMNQNYQNNKRRNFNNQNTYNNNNQANNGMNSNQQGGGSSSSGTQGNRRYQNNSNNGNNNSNNNNMGQNQAGQYANNGGNKYNKGHMNSNGSNNKMGKQNQWGGNQNQQAGQDHQNGMGMDGYYENNANNMTQQYDTNQAYTNQYQNQPTNFMMHEQQNTYQQ